MDLCCTVQSAITRRCYILVYETNQTTICEAMLSKSSKDQNFQLQYLVKNKAQRLLTMEELMTLLKDKCILPHTVINSNSNGNCKNTECNLEGPPKHVPAECWMTFLEKMS